MVDVQYYILQQISSDTDTMPIILCIPNNNILSHRLLISLLNEESIPTHQH